MFSMLGNVYITVLLALSSYTFVYEYLTDGTISWAALLVLLLMLRELVKKRLKVGDMTVTKPYDAMNRREKGFSLTLKALVLMVWMGFMMLVFNDGGAHMNSPYVSIFYGLILMCMVMDVLLYRIRKRNDQFLI